MCGRYMITSPFEAMAQLFEATPGPLGVDAPRPNVSPTEAVPAVVAAGGARRLAPMRLAFFARDQSLNDRPLLINARSETLAEKPAFRDAPERGAAWSPPTASTSGRARRARGRPFVIRAARRRSDRLRRRLAGLARPRGARSPTCAIVTCAANATLAPIHDRMPVLIAPADFGLWLGEAGPAPRGSCGRAPDDALDAEPADPGPARSSPAAPLTRSELTAPCSSPAPRGSPGWSRPATARPARRRRPSVDRASRPESRPASGRSARSTTSAPPALASRRAAGISRLRR